MIKSRMVSESLSLWLKSIKKLPNHFSEHYPPKEKMLMKVIWHLFRRFELLSEKLSEIKPSLANLRIF